MPQNSLKQCLMKHMGENRIDKKPCIACIKCEYMFEGDDQYTRGHQMCKAVIIEVLGVDVWHYIPKLNTLPPWCPLEAQKREAELVRWYEGYKIKKKENL